MDSDEKFWIATCQGLGNDGPVVAASRDKFRIPKLLGHQFGEEIGIDIVIQSDTVGKACAEDGWHNHIERGVRVAAVFGGISEPINDLVVAIEGIGKAVDQ